MNPRPITPATLCRLDAAALGAADDVAPALRDLAACAGWLVAAASVYGASFGLWRAPEQALYAAIKMPAALLAITALSAGANALVAQTLGLDLGARRTLLLHLTGFAIAAIVLAALAPAFAFLAASLPPPGARGDRTVYAALLSTHTAAVALAGLTGYARVYRLLRRGTADRARVRRVLAAWIALSGFVGSEVCWICTPMLARPDLPVSFLNPNAFKMNMYEYLWQQWQPPRLSF